MKKTFALILAIALLWVSACPLLYFLAISAPSKIAGAPPIDLPLPVLSQAVMTHVNLGRVILMTMLASLIALIIWWRGKRLERFFLPYLAVLGLWQISLLVIYVAAITPYFKIYESLG